MNEDEKKRLTDRILKAGLYPETVERYLSDSLVSLTDLRGQEDLFAGASKKVCILYTSRSGSTYLTDALNKTALLGDAQEYLETPMLEAGLRDPKIESLADYLRKTVRASTTDNGVFSIKATHGALFPMAVVGEVPDKAHDWRWVFVYREDFVAQAVSLYRARQTGVWHKKAGSDRRIPTPRYDYNGILSCYRAIVRAHGQIEQFLNRQNLDGLRLSYEEISQDLGKAVNRVFGHVGIGLSPTASREIEKDSYEVLRNRETEIHAERFRSEMSDSYHVARKPRGNGLVERIRSAFGS